MSGSATRALVAAVALAASGCGDGGRDTPDAQEPPAAGREAEAGPRDRIGELIESRADALARGDTRGYVATATGAQRARDRETMRNRRAVPLAAAGYDVVEAEVGERRAVVEARATYRVRGIAGEYAGTRRLVAVRDGGDWRIRREGSARDRPPWEIGPYRAVRTDHFTLLAPAGADLGALPAALEDAYERIRRRIVRPRPRRRYLVVVAGDAAAAQRMTAFIRGTDQLAAITDAKVRDDGPAKQVTDVVSLRLLVVLSAFAPLAPDEQGRVITHELAHAVLTQRTSGRTPAWLNEGVALYLSEDRRVGHAATLVADAGSRAERRALTLTGLSSPDAIARLAGRGQTAAYAYASAAAHYVADRFGERRLLRLYEAFNDPALPGDGGPATTDAATRRVLDRPLATLERDLRRWIVTRAIVEPFAP